MTFSVPAAIDRCREHNSRRKFRIFFENYEIPTEILQFFLKFLNFSKKL